MSWTSAPDAWQVKPRLRLRTRGPSRTVPSHEQQAGATRRQRAGRQAGPLPRVQLDRHHRPPPAGGTGALIVGGALAAVGTLLPWFDVAGGTTVAGVETMAGIGTLVLAVTAVAIGLFILQRPDHPQARSAAWGGLVAVLGIGALGVIAALTTGRSEGTTTAAGLLISFAGGMVATTGCRALLDPPLRRALACHPACIHLMHTQPVTTRRSPVSVGTAFHPRTAPLNRKMQWREWAGYFASSVYADFHDIEYNAIREAAAVIDVSPLYKYRVTGPDALRLADRVITRDATRMKVGQVYYTPWCDEHGKVIDDGTVHRVGEEELRWTAADPQYRWLTPERRRPRRRDRGRHGVAGRARAPGPVQPRRPGGRHRRELRGPRLLPPPREPARRRADRRQPHRLHGRPGLRAVDPGRCRHGRLGRAVRRRQGLRDPARGDPGARRRPPRGGDGHAGGGLHVRAPRHEPGPELQPVRDRPRASS